MWHSWHLKGLSVVCVNICIFNDHCFEYSLLQISHLCLIPLWVSICRSKWLFCLYRFGHRSQAYGFSPVCSLLCKIKYEARLNFLSQSGHLTVFPVCRVIWVFKIVFCENDFPQILHSYGFSPVWILLWHFSAFPWAKRRPQVWHWYGRSPVWILLWDFKRNSVAKLFEQISQAWFLSPVWTYVWIFNLWFVVNPLPQVEHKNDAFGRFSGIWT